MQIRSLTKLSRAGVTIALGDDSGIQNSFPGYAALQQLERMAESGMTPQQVLVAATRTAAAVLRLTDMGSIAPGKSASFVVLEAKPARPSPSTNTRSRTAFPATLRGSNCRRMAESGMTPHRCSSPPRARRRRPAPHRHGLDRAGQERELRRARWQPARPPRERQEDFEGLPPRAGNRSRGASRAMDALKTSSRSRDERIIEPL